MGNVIIKFTGSWRGYSAEEVAGFPEDIAKSLIDGGRAELYEGKKAGKSSGKGKGAPAPETPPQPGPSTEPPPGVGGAENDADDDKP